MHPPPPHLNLPVDTTTSHVQLQVNNGILMGRIQFDGASFFIEVSGYHTISCHAMPYNTASQAVSTSRAKYHD